MGMSSRFNSPNHGPKNSRHCRQLAERDAGAVPGLAQAAHLRGEQRAVALAGDSVVYAGGLIWHSGILSLLVYGYLLRCARFPDLVFAQLFDLIGPAAVV